MCGPVVGGAESQRFYYGKDTRWRLSYEPSNHAAVFCGGEFDLIPIFNLKKKQKKKTHIHTQSLLVNLYRPLNTPFREDTLANTCTRRNRRPGGRKISSSATFRLGVELLDRTSSTRTWTPGARHGLFTHPPWMKRALTRSSRPDMPLMWTFFPQEHHYPSLVVPQSPFGWSPAEKERLRAGGPHFPNYYATGRYQGTGGIAHPGIDPKTRGELARMPHMHREYVRQSQSLHNEIPRANNRWEELERPPGGERNPPVGGFDETDFPGRAFTGNTAVPSPGPQRMEGTTSFLELVASTGTSTGARTEAHFPARRHPIPIACAKWARGVRIQRTDRTNKLSQNPSFTVPSKT